MLLIKWIVRMFLDLLRFGIVNRAFGMSLAVLALIFLGLVIVGAKLAAPFIYALF